MIELPSQRTTEPLTPAKLKPTSNAWARGQQVEVPGAGVGRVIENGNHGPRIIEMDLPAPAAAVFIVRGQDGPRAVVLTDPRVDPKELARTVAAASVLEAEIEGPEMQHHCPRRSSRLRPPLAAAIVAAACVICNISPAACAAVT